MSWDRGSVSIFQREGPEGRKIPNFIIRTIFPALALTSHFVDHSWELLSGSWEVTPEF